MVDGQVLVARVGGVAAAKHTLVGGGGGDRVGLFFVVFARLRAEVEDEGDEDARQAEARPYAQGLVPHPCPLSATVCTFNLLGFSQ